MPLPVRNQEYSRYRNIIGMILGIPLLFLLIICPFLEFLNIQFSQYIPGPTKAKWEKFIVEGFYILVWWIVAASIYTTYMVVYDQDEIHNIPFFCPTSYDYQSKLIRAACKIRFLDMICMWLYVLFSILWYGAGILDYLPRKEDMKWWNEWFGDEENQKKEFTTNQTDMVEWVQSSRRESFAR
ncbi:14800_t:CDS:2 [Dentiscutata erythropus]|uniref:14800_t:CDS:1 n=1 Tax=Dentiscutata erythropus TaxID=1348616 RepID=A0A9N8V6I3_9GLOM|nr:14800_t:CDS:2 [Dentiscutata erythropus]